MIVSWNIFSLFVCHLNMILFSKKNKNKNKCGSSCREFKLSIVTNTCVWIYFTSISTKELDDASTFNVWLERFRKRYNRSFGVISGEGTSLRQNITDDWQWRLSTIVQDYHPVEIYNCDQASLFYK